MTDPKKKIPPAKTTVKVSPGLLLEINNEQNRLLNSGQGKVSQGDIVHRAWRAYKGGSAPGESLVSNGSTIRTGAFRTETINYGGIQLQESELPWVQGLLKVLRGKNEDSKTAIMTNIIAFAGYSAMVPEVSGEGVSIDALEARLAAIDKQILDEGKIPEMGSSSAKSKARKHASGKAGEK